MNKIVETAASLLDERVKGFDGTAKFVIEDEGAVLIDASGAHPADAGTEAEVTLTASRDTFEAILSGEMNPTAAYMTGKLSVEGSIPTAMKLAAVLS